MLNHEAKPSALKKGHGVREEGRGEGLGRKGYHPGFGRQMVIVES